MSRALRVFTDYFIKGLGIGTHWMDKAEDRELKKQQAAAQLAHWQEQAWWRRNQLAETQRLNTAKIAQAGAYTDYLKRKNVGGGGGAAGGPNENVAGLWAEFGETAPKQQNVYIGGGGSSDAAPPPDLGSGSPGGGGFTDTETDARGGRVGKARPAFQRGGAVNTSPMGRFATGFMSGMNRQRNRGNYDLQTGQPLPRPVTPPIMPGNMPMAEAQSYGSAGTTGPGSGYGEIAAPPVTTSTSGYERGGRVQSFQGGGTPTPVVRGNLRQTSDGTYVDDQGRLVDLPVQEYERADPRYDATRISVPPPMLGRSWEKPPSPPDPNAPDVRDPDEQRRAARAVARRSDEVAAAAPQKTDQDTAIDLESPTERMRALAWKGRQSPMPGPFPPRPDAPRSVTNPPNPDDYDAPSRGSYERRRPPTPRGGGAAAGTEPDVPPQGTPQLGVGAGLAGLGVGGGEPTDDEAEQRRQAREARERNVSKRNWVPPDRAGDVASDQVDRAGAQSVTSSMRDEEVYPPSGAPGPQYTNQPAGAPPKGPTQYGPGTEGPPARPRVAGGGGGGGAPRQGIATGADAAFDPSKQQLDPRSGYTIDASGRVTPISQVPSTRNGAISATPPVTEPAGGYGMNPQGSNVYGAGLSSNNAARDYNYAIQGASNHAKTTYGDTPQAKLAVAQGHGAASPVDVDNVFKIVDPDNKLAPHDKMIAATKAVHDFHMAKGDQKAADAASFAITQWGNGMAKQHGAEAMKALQKGDQNGAMNHLMAGYGWIPDSGTPQYDQRSNSIVVRGPDGSVSATIPVQAGTLQNLSLGMMSGQLAWDVIHSSTGTQMGGDHPQAQAQAPQPSQAPPAQAPPAARPAAQPQAAPAGPAAPPPAAAPSQVAPQPSPPGSAGPMPSPQAMTPPSPQTAATQPPAPAPTPTPSAAPTPPAATPAPPAGPAPGTVSFAPSGADTSGVTFGDKPQAIQTTAPTTPPAPPPPPSKATPTGGAAAPATPSAPQTTSGQEQRVSTTPPQGGGEQETPQQKAKREGDEFEQKHWDKNPYAPLPIEHRETAGEPSGAKARNQAQIQKIADDFKADEQAIIKRAAERGLISRKSNNIPSSVRELINMKRKDAEARIKELQAEGKQIEDREYKENRYDIEHATPIHISPTDEEKLQQGYAKQRENMDEMVTKNPNGATAQMKNNSPLRYANKSDIATVDTIATQIYAQNSHKLTPSQAYEIALQATSIQTPSKDIPDPVGLNRQKGGNATKFTPLAIGQRGPTIGGQKQNNVLLQFGDGTQVLVDQPTYNRIKSQHQINWAQYEKAEKERKAQEEQDKKTGFGWRHLGAAVRTVAPFVQSPIGATLKSLEKPTRPD